MSFKELSKRAKKARQKAFIRRQRKSWLEYHCQSICKSVPVFLFLLIIIIGIVYIIILSEA